VDGKKVANPAHGQWITAIFGMHVGTQKCVVLHIYHTISLMHNQRLGVELVE